MKKKILGVLLVTFLLFSAGCSNKKAEEFKNEYESLNGMTNKSGKEHRTVNIDKNNPFEKVSAQDILDKIDKKETFYVYFGDKLCPWCRSVIEKAIEVANKEKIKKIYYVAIWDDEGNEILRDKYERKDGQSNKVKDGTTEYYKLLEAFDNVLNEYSYTHSDGREDTFGEKRIYAPNFIYVKDGKSVKMTEGISDKQSGARDELTEEILKDEEKLFTEFFNN